MNRVSSRKLEGRSYYRDLPTLVNIVNADLLKLRKGQLGTAYYINQSDCDDQSLFWCEDGQDCLSIVDRCDGINDCLDLSDESNCSSVSPPTSNTYDNLTGGENGILNIDLYNKIDWTTSPDWFDAYKLSNFEDLRDLYDFTLMDRDLVENTGNDVNSFIRSCAYDQQECSVDDFHQFEHVRYGNCFTFNAPIGNDGNFNESQIVRTGRTGGDYGLKLTLFVDSDDYLGLLGQNTGVKVVIHSARIEPDLIADSFIASVGYETEVALTRETISRLPDPYSTCINTYPDFLPMSDVNRQFDYNRRVCQSYCYQYHMNLECGCYDDYTVQVDTLCDFKDSAIAVCKASVDLKFILGELTCACDQECDSESYSKVVSAINWPSVNYLPFFASFSWQQAIADKGSAGSGCFSPCTELDQSRPQLDQSSSSVRHQSSPGLGVALFFIQSRPSLGLVFTELSP
ncbi:epithelial sodium channel subunit gamma-like, partial [Convolutriloba macropyga]|uniref:epithelial sodium channel subunit gamma-like n=1 Tax=Convolutriloba macropyga TaxID=536237 RepID=UPI003F51FCAF